MAQVLKPEVKSAIAEAALRVFAREGFAQATMAMIAHEAGISAGNVYRYYAGKDVLFEEVVPAAWVRRFRALLRARVLAARGHGDARSLARDEVYARAAEAIVEHTISHRLRTIIVLGRAEGTRYARVRQSVIEELTSLAEAHARAVRGPVGDPELLRFTLARVYEGFVATHVAALERFDDPARIRAAVITYGAYHLPGLASLLGGATP